MSRMKSVLRRGWKYAVAFGVVGAIVAYTVPRLLSSGEESIRGALNPAAPITVRVRHPGEYQSEDFFTPMYLFPSRSPDSVPAEVREPGGPEYYAWARENGGVPGQEQPLRITLRGRNEEPVIIDGIRPRVVERGEPLEGWFTHDRGCGGVVIRKAEIDLDADRPTIAFQNVDENDPAAEQLALTLQVTSTDTETIDILALTRRFSVKWVLEVLYSAAGENGVFVVDDGGEPFELTALQRGRARFHRGEFGGELVREASGDPGENGMTFC